MRKKLLKLKINNPRKKKLKCQIDRSIAIPWLTMVLLLDVLSYIRLKPGLTIKTKSKILWQATTMTSLVFPVTLAKKI